MYAMYRKAETLVKRLRLETECVDLHADAPASPRLGFGCVHQGGADAATA
jgi:hypothetical protein